MERGRKRVGAPMHRCSDAPIHRCDIEFLVKANGTFVICIARVQPTASFPYETLVTHVHSRI
jgi:hypothetical protein